ncbi:hypothetical protein PRZ48_002528 [Zasmidium cellare]|uniref:Uncharacterized protein n=1 Tax=Zasmidium cellare TaxID=395010 RepID=A0ABR0F4A7_ZASCE|nr:hypothetical protein PRZ48_002528 [Zasmidium cellare]
MAYRQQQTPSTDFHPNTTAPTSMQSSVDDEAAEMQWKVDPMDQPDETNEEPVADGDLLPPTLTFVHNLMRSNEAYMTRVERLLGEQERLVRELNGKELTILKLKTALEREKDARAKLEERVGQADQAVVKSDNEDENGLQSPLEDGELAQREAQPAVSDDAYDGDLRARLQDELVRLDQKYASSVEAWSGDRPVAQEEDWENGSMHVQDDEDFRTPGAMEPFAQHTDQDLMPFRKKRKAEAMPTNMHLYNLQIIIGQHFPTYKFTPLFETPNGTPGYGALDSLSPSIHNSLQNLLIGFQARRERLQGSKCPPPVPTQNLVSCGALWMTGSTSNRAWTRHAPGMYTCKTCFNARRPCFVWNAADGRWLILPLPPQVRSGAATWRERGYYVFEGNQVFGQSFAGVWEESYETKRKRERERAVVGEGRGAGGGGEDMIQVWEERGDMPGWAIA